MSNPNSNQNSYTQSSLNVIYTKEVRQFFKTPLFYFLAALSTLLMSVTFILGLSHFAQVQNNAVFQMQSDPQLLNIHYAVFLQHLSILNLLMMFFVPALAMRLISEEKKNRTFDLLMTSPIKSVDIVLGKFFALMTVVIAFASVAFLYILISRRLFEFTWSTTLVAWVGMIFVSAIYAAISLFASSLTQSSLVAFTLGIVFNISIWIFGGLGEVVDSTWAKPVIDQISLNYHLQSLVEGVIKSNGIVYFLSIISLFLFLCERIIESTRWSAS